MSKLPVYNVSRILQTKAKLESHPDLLALMFSPVEGELFDELVTVLHRELPVTAPYDVIEDSCRYMLGEELTPEMLATVSWRLAANAKRLKNCHPVQPWTGQPVPEWVVAQVVGWEIAANKRRKTGANLTFKILAGRAVTESCTEFWTRKYCHMMSRRMGFSRYNGPYPFTDARELTSLRLFLRIEPNKGELSFDQMAVPSGCLAWNKKQIRRRARVGFRCPKKFPDSHYCYQCHVGRDQCAAAVHPVTYVKKHCDQCNRQSWFSTDAVCVDCAVINTLTHKDE